MRKKITNIIKLPVPNGFRLEAVNNILFFEAKSNYTRIFFDDGDSVLICKTLKTFEEILPKKYFFRISRTYIINLLHVKKYYHKNCIRILLSNGKELFLSKRRKKDFLQLIEKLF